MNVFDTHRRIVDEYSSYIKSFINISDEEIENKVREELAAGKLWPEPLLQFNPSFKMAGAIESFVDQQVLHPDAANIFSGYSLYQHQLDAIRLGTTGNDFVVTSGTGSGKSLTYIASIFDQLLRNPGEAGVVAVVVYPMNALINSQSNELNGYRSNYTKATGRPLPFEFAQYTGQEKEDVRERLRETPPQILLTNYMMLELLLTRGQERGIRDAIYKNLKFLVFDELHTYRGRQGADIAMLIRRIQAECANHVTCIGTSATMTSVGSVGSQREQVAAIASTIFGRPFSPDQVVQETLTRSLKNDGDVSTADLSAALETSIDTDAPESLLRQHPLAVWLENNVALEENDGALRRRQPGRIDLIVKSLATASSLPADLCAKRLPEMLLWISKVNQTIQASGSRYTILPFKLHQFFAQTGSVYTTLDQEPHERFITLEPGLYKRDEQPKKPIFPNVFSRETGRPFICVSWVDERLIPREFRMSGEEELKATDGYLIIGDDVWNPDEDLEYLPDAWVQSRRGVLTPDKKKEHFFPQKIYFDAYGNCSTTEEKDYWGWFMRAPLLFDPTGGVFFDTRTNEGTKLTKLGSEGRSTSTTITAFSILNELRDSGFSDKDQKLLSFTDNRQDAALQAGHFNDFVQVIRLRSAIFQALQTAPGQLLDYSNIGSAVFNALQLDFGEYAAAVETAFPNVRRRIGETLQDYLFFRALSDLRRSWRIVLPNLEQCGLLRVEYRDIDEVAAADEAWSDVPILRLLDAQERREFITDILDFFRLEQAVHSENFLQPTKLREFERRFREELKAPWTLDENEKLRQPYVVRLDQLNRAEKMYSKSIGPTSGVGKYIKHFAKLHPRLDAEELRGENYRTFITALLDKLEAADYLVRIPARDTANQKVSVFRLKIDTLQWRLGDGETVRADVIKRRSYKDRSLKPNIFFRDIYKRDYSQAKRLRAGDHTAQLSVAERQDREDRFRCDWLGTDGVTPDWSRIKRESLSALFCSPTMELGVDIGGLTVIHLRNAPPNPANYAQRSGRGGRNGQGALIFNYCSSYSPHDRHYFEHQAEIVAGVVQAPRIDLINQELLTTHLNAMALGEVGLPLGTTANDKPSLMALVDGHDPKFPLSFAVRAGLSLGQETKNRLKTSFTRVIAGLENELNEKAADWYDPDWLERRLVSISDHLDSSLQRWRDLYTSARALLSKATQAIDSGLLVVGTEEYRKYKRLQDQANRQLNLLRNQQEGFADLSEFYPYRYLAAEGFLPGYNFTRLPLRVFIPVGASGGEFISRSRHLALREFGPHNVLYHSGRKFKISQMVVQDAEAKLEQAKVSKRSGYFMRGDDINLEFCPFSGESLHENSSKRYFHDLLEMTEARAEPIDRISCEEEERVSRGFDIETFFSVDGGDMNRIKRARVRSTEASLLNLRYVPAARLVYVNNKWRSQQIDGFPIGMVSGDWISSMPDPDANAAEEIRLVKLFTSNVADALYIEPIEALGLSHEGVVTLQYALKRAIEELFQIEPNELGVMTMGDQSAPNIMLYEAAEGNLGILSQFVQNPKVFTRTVERAQQICRFEDSTYLAPASYDDLLSYYNQRDHAIIDRFLIRDALEKLRISELEIETNKSFMSYDEHYEYMLANLDPNSSTERVFIQHLYQNGLRLPDFAQKRLDGIYCQPDFYYDPRIWVFCDGTPHDDPEIMNRDRDQRQLIIAKGDEVWFWHYKEDLAEKVAARPDIFQKVR